MRFAVDGQVNSVVTALAAPPPFRARWNVLENVATNKDLEGSFVSGDVDMTGSKGLPVVPDFDGVIKLHVDAIDSGAKDPPNSQPPDLNPRRVGTSPKDFLTYCLQL